MFDSESLRPVIIAMTLYVLIAHFVPQLAKKPTGVKMVDDVIMFLITQKGAITSGTIVVGVITYLTNYINDEML
jgi:RsiW-degrading membrane proteinase PrsW (M82 family)